MEGSEMLDKDTMKLIAEAQRKGILEDVVQRFLAEKKDSIDEEDRHALEVADVGKKIAEDAARQIHEYLVEKYGEAEEDAIPLERKYDFYYLCEEIAVQSIARGLSLFDKKGYKKMSKMFMDKVEMMTKFQRLVLEEDN